MYASTFYGNLSGNATSATTATTATKANYLTNYSSAYTTPGLSDYSLSYYTSVSSTTSASTNGIANPTSAWYYHITMIHGDSNGYFCDVAWRLSDHSDPSMYFRIRNSSNYTGWIKVLTSENYTDYISGGGGGSISISNYSNTFYPCGYTSYSGSNITALKAYSGFYVTSTGAYHTSDIRKKCDIQDIYDDEITKLFNTHHGYIHSFRWRDTDKPAFGFIAQELLEYCPEAVDYNIDTGFYTVNYEMALSKIVGVLFKKIKKQDSEIKKLRKLLENRK